jgi:hypothetical protein
MQGLSYNGLLKDAVVKYITHVKPSAISGKFAVINGEKQTIKNDLSTILAKNTITPNNQLIAAMAYL